MLNVHVQPWCEERDCRRRATHVVVIVDSFAARLCQAHAAEACSVDADDLDRLDRGAMLRDGLVVVRVVVHA